MGVFLSSGGKLFHSVDPLNTVLFLKVSLLGKGMFRTGPSYCLVLPSVLSKYISFWALLYINFRMWDSARSPILLIPETLYN